MEDDDQDSDEYTSDQIIAFLQQQPSLQTLTILSDLASSNELRDYDDLFQSQIFYSLSANLLQRCWKAYDLHHLMGDENQHELFELQQSQRSSRSHSGLDDEEELEGEEILNKIGSQQQQNQSWQQLQCCYTYLSHLFSAPEFDSNLASQRNAFDNRFANQLINRFSPRQRKKLTQQQQQQQQQPLTNGQLMNIVGIGGTAAQLQHLASVPASILASVGVGIGVGIRAAEPDEPTAAELAALRGFLHHIYNRCVSHRQHILSLMASFIQHFLRNSAFPQGIPEILAVYAAIVKGYKTPLLNNHRQYLLKNIMPLHLPNNMQNELTPTMQFYHEQLVYSILQFIKKDQQTESSASTTLTNTSHGDNGNGTAASSSTISVVSLLPILNQLLSAWPTSRQPNSAKEVLILHEFEQLLEFASLSTFASFAPTFFPFLLSSLSSSHHRVSERCLQLWQNDHFLTLIASQRQLFFPQLFPILLQEKHWNKSVNKMRVIVMETSRDQDPILYKELIHQIYHKETIEASLAAAEQMLAAMRPAPDSTTSTEDILLQTQVIVPPSLTHVQYNDFVFGHLLGEGSFSQVRYAKKIIKGQLPSTWPEYAIKVMNRELILAQNYMENVEREMAIMTLFHHENVNTLIATCSNDHHLYFVLEYAKKGDLFTHLSALGSFDVATARFISAEILRGLEHIHNAGVVWCDCKPENVLVHQSGHVKLTDFGSSRRLSEIKAGDRMEGTEDYLAPEVIRGESGPSQAADLWAFACLLYQLLAGRTPMWAGAGESTEGKGNKKKKKGKGVVIKPSIATPPSSSSADSPSHSEQKEMLIEKMVHFETLIDKFPPGFDESAKQLISSILLPNPSRRLSILAHPEIPNQFLIDYKVLKSHPFYEGIQWDVLHTLPAPSLSSGGSVAPAPDAKWARRKNSLMWAPMPKAYSFNDSSFIILDTIPEDPTERQPIQQRSNKSSSDEGARMKYVGFQPDANMKKVEEAQEDEDEDEEEDDESGGLLLSAKDLMDLDDEDSKEMTSSIPPRLSSRAKQPVVMRSSGDSSAVLPPSHPPSSSSSPSSLPPRPRLGIRSAPPPSSAPVRAVPNASPLVGVSVPNLMMGAGPRIARSNPTAQSLLARVLGNPPATGSAPNAPTDTADNNPASSKTSKPTLHNNS